MENLQFEELDIAELDDNQANETDGGFLPIILGVAAIVAGTYLYEKYHS
jgi:hypothetical protein